MENNFEIEDILRLDNKKVIEHLKTFTDDAYIEKQEEFNKLLLIYILNGTNRLNKSQINIDSSNIVEDIESSIYSIYDQLDDIKEIKKELKIVNEYPENEQIYISSLICEALGNFKCTEIGSKISNALIRVSATRIFTDPEQSILELIANSIDSYNTMEGRPTIGKFGMGFFSILFWLAESNPLTNNFDRLMEIRSSYLENDEVISYLAKIEWTKNGLKISYEYIKSVIQKTGTEIKIYASKQEFTENNISLMLKYCNKLSNITNVRIIVLDENSNSEIGDKNSLNQIIVELDSKFISCTDFAQGLPLNILFNNLLVPSSSSKERKKDVSIEKLESTITPYHQTQLDIIVNGVSIVSLTLNSEDYLIEDFRFYRIYLPNDTRLPVARDDIIYTEYEINHLRKQINNIFILIDNRTKNLISFFKLFETYVNINKQNILFDLFNEIKEQLAQSDKFLIPNTDFWNKLIKEFNIINYFYYPYIDKFKLSQQLYPYVENKLRDDIFKSRLCIRMDLGENNLCELDQLPLYLFINGNLDDQNILNKVCSSSSNTMLIPFNENIDLKFNLSYFYIILPENIKNILRMFHMTIFKKMQNITYKEDLFTNLLESYFLLCDNDNNEFKDFLNFIYLLNDKISSFELEFPYGIEKRITNFNLVISYVNYKLSFQFLKNKNKNLDKFIYENQITLDKIYSKFSLDDIDNKRKKRLILLSLFSDYISFTYNKIIDFTKSYEKEDKKYFDELKEIFESKICENIVNYTNKKIYSYLVSLIRTTVASTLYVPNIEEVLNKEMLILLNKESILEIKETVDKCTTNEELYIYCITLRNFIERYIQELLYNNSNGIFSYILHEIRRKYTNNYLEHCISYAVKYLIGGLENINSIMEDLTNWTYSYFQSKNNDIYFDIKKLNIKYSFTAKSLISYIYNNEINSVDFFKKVDKYNKTFNPVDFKLQIIEIASNEGTTKPFIQAVLTELVQNSIDAIKSKYQNTQYNEQIDVKTSNNGIIIKDNIGIDDLNTIITFLVPFLSTKDPNDPNVTGEMGTGFFNVYRQPFVKYVLITTVKNNNVTKIKGTPILVNNIINDIKYEIETYTDNHPNMTEIMIIFNEDSPDLINDVNNMINNKMGYNLINFVNSNKLNKEQEFIYNNIEKIKASDKRAIANKNFTLEKLKEISKSVGIKAGTTKIVLINKLIDYYENLNLNIVLQNIDITLNSNIINKGTKLIYKDENIGEILIMLKNNNYNSLNDSIVLVNNGYFNDLNNFLSTNNYVNQLLIDNSGKSIIVNFYKNSYFPSQARTSIRFKDNLNIHKFLSDGLYFVTLYKYLLGYSTDLIIRNTSSVANINQLKLYNNVTYEYSNMKNKIPFDTYITNYIIEKETDKSAETIASNINLNISNISNDKELKTLTDITSKLKINNLVNDVITKWFSNKDKSKHKKEVIAVKTDKETKDKDKDITSEDIKIKWNNLQVFIDEYWKLLKKLVNNNIIESDIKLNMLTPEMFSGSSKNNSAGFYSPSHNCIVLVSKYYNKKAFDIEIVNILRMTKKEALLYFQTNDIFIKYFANNSTTSLIHEIGHAIRKEDHSGSSHGLTDIKVDKSNILLFDDMCLKIYNKLLQEGLMSNYYDALTQR